MPAPGAQAGGQGAGLQAGPQGGPQAGQLPRPGAQGAQATGQATLCSPLGG